jgi:hypothetical protein
VNPLTRFFRILHSLLDEANSGSAICPKHISHGGAISIGAAGRSSGARMSIHCDSPAAIQNAAHS